MAKQQKETNKRAESFTLGAYGFSAIIVKGSSNRCSDRYRASSRFETLVKDEKMNCGRRQSQRLRKQEQEGEEGVGGEDGG